MTRTQLVSEIGITAFVLALAAGGALTAWLQQPWPMIAFVFIGAYLLFAIKVADQWEKVAVLRFGRYIGLRGPGLFYMIPIVDRSAGCGPARARGQRDRRNRR